MALSSDDILSRLREAYQRDKGRFEKYFPDLVDIVRVEQARTSNTFGLTEREREDRIKKLKQCLANQPLTREVAIEALQHYGALAESRWRPDDVPPKTISRLVSVVIGKPLSDVRRKCSFDVASQKRPSREVAVLAGVRLAMTWDFELVAITVDPARRKGASSFLASVGSGNDPRSDVSTRHDDYLAEEAPHAHS